jgi:hypothetical protein
MRWSLAATPDGYDFSGADQLVDFALSNGQRLRGHTLGTRSMVLPSGSTRNSTRQETLQRACRADGYPHDHGCPATMQETVSTVGRDQRASL